MVAKRETRSELGNTEPKTRWYEKLRRKHKHKTAVQTDPQPIACDEGSKVGLITLLSCLITIVLTLRFFLKPQTSKVPLKNSDSGPSNNQRQDLAQGNDDYNCDIVLGNDISQQEDLWQNAYKALEARNPDLVTRYKLALAAPDDSQTDCAQMPLPELVDTVVKKKLEDREQKQLVIHLGEKPIKVREQGEKVIKFILWSNKSISAAVSAQPYAALAWAGVSILLPVSCATIQNDIFEC